MAATRSLGLLLSARFAPPDKALAGGRAAKAHLLDGALARLALVLMMEMVDDREMEDGERRENWCSKNLSIRFKRDKVN